MKGGSSLSAAAAVVLLAAALGVSATALLYQRFAGGVVHAQTPGVAPRVLSATERSGPDDKVGSRRLPADARQTILVGSYPVADPTSAEGVRTLTHWLEGMGFKVYYANADLGRHGRWQRVLAGAYTDPETARRDVVRLENAAPGSGARLVSAGFATGTMEQ